MPGRAVPPIPTGLGLLACAVDSLANRRCGAKCWNFVPISCGVGLSKCRCAAAQLAYHDHGCCQMMLPQCADRTCACESCARHVFQHLPAAVGQHAHIAVARVSCATVHPAACTRRLCVSAGRLVRQGAVLGGPSSSSCVHVCWAHPFGWRHAGRDLNQHASVEGHLAPRIYTACRQLTVLLYCLGCWVLAQQAGAARGPPPPEPDRHCFARVPGTTSAAS